MADRDGTALQPPTSGHGNGLCARSRVSWRSMASCGKPLRVFGSWGARAAPALLLYAALSGLASAQPTTPAPTSLARPSVKAVRIDAAEAPTIDGDLSDPVWAKAGVIDRFTQKSPNPGEPATERTVLRILYDQNNLYFSFYAYDSHPYQIIPGSMERDGRLPLPTP